MSKIYDASSEFKKVEVSEKSTGSHPRPRIGATAKKAGKLESRRTSEKAAPVTTKKKK